MRIRYLLLALVVAIGLSYVGSGSASDGDYPLFALPNGIAVGVGNPYAVQVPPPIAVDIYDIVEEPEDLVADPPPGNNSTLLWGYEASFGNSQMRSYNLAPFAAGPTCVPDMQAGGPTGNGRGVAFDPMDGNVWMSRLDFFTGDGLIHKIKPPNVTPGTCPQVGVIPFGDGPGGTVQDDIGAIDLDEASKHLWVAGYAPVIVAGAARSYIYKVNRNNGKILNSCWVPFGGGGIGNDTLSSFRNTTLPGSSKYLVTDAGEVETPLNGNVLLVIDQASCHSGREAMVVVTVPKTTPAGMTGIDFEWPGLLNTNGCEFPFTPFTCPPGASDLFNNGAYPFTMPTLLGPTGALFGLEDISLCAYRAKFGGDGNDACPY